MINPFYGELGLIETPLEVSHNFCSHKCGYCFANLNKPDRKADVKKIFNQLMNYEKSETYTSLLIKEGFPIAVSNKSDAFALSNYKITLPMLRLMHDKKIPVVIQSRGGYSVDEFLGFYKIPHLWIISITHTNDDTRKLIEPGAPSIESRWQLVDKLKSLGHRVIVSINPYSSKWIDNGMMAQKLEDHTPHGVLIQNIHLNHSQMSNMTEKELEAGGEVYLSAKKKRTKEEFDLTMDLYRKIKSYNIPVLYYSYPTKTGGIDKIYSSVYEKHFNTHWSFTDWCFDNKKEGDEVYWDEYISHMTENIPFANNPFSIQSYCTSICRAFRQGGETLPTRLSLKDVFAVYWNDYRLNRQLNNYVNYYQKMVFTDKEKNEIAAKFDKNNFRIFQFTAGERNDLFIV